MDANIVGWGHTRFGVQSERSFKELIQSAAKKAIEHAGIDPAEIDAIWLGHFNAGMAPDAFALSLVLGSDDALRFTPATRVENASASGSAAIYTARDEIRAGMADGSLPVNLSGGLKAKGHPVGATGVPMHVMAARQATGSAGETQKKSAGLGCVHDIGGSGVANNCSILEAVR